MAKTKTGVGPGGRRFWSATPDKPSHVIRPLPVAAEPAMVTAGIEACDGQLHAATIRKVYAAMVAAYVSSLPSNSQEKP